MAGPHPPAPLPTLTLPSPPHCSDNVVIVCSIENVDPMGVHTGDSVTVAPAQTLTDKEYQRLRDAAVDIIREMGVECGGSNVQMAVNPADGEVRW